MSKELTAVYPLADYRIAHELVDVSDPTPMPPDVAERMQKALAKSFEETVWLATLGKRPHVPRPTALRLAPGGRSFETVELDDAGNVIEPVRCNCVVFHRVGCPLSYGAT